MLHLNHRNRRGFLSSSSQGLGGIALAGLLNPELFAGDESQTSRTRQFAPKAKRVIYLFQSGGPPHHDLFDPKPHLDKVHGEEVPESVFQGQRLTGMTAGQNRFPVARSIFPFRPFGESGIELNAKLLPHLGKVVDEIALIRSMHTEAINHDPAITFFQTGFQLAGRPSIGAWLSYGLGSENENLPAFVAMTSNRSGQALYDRLWGAGFLPSRHQGVRLRSGKNPVLYLSNPEGINQKLRRETMNDLSALNELHFQDFGDPEIRARIAQYEMAFRMQQSVPELADLSDEPKSTFELYGKDAAKPGTFAYNALMARRLSEQGVRFVQLFHRGWDTHGNLPGQLRQRCKETDQASAALILDLKQRGLLDETLIVWGGEFGRTVYCQGNLTEKSYGRDHHPRCFSLWLAGGGIKGGTTYGRTDDYGYNIAENPVSVHDLHATILHLLGVDHEKLTYKFQGRKYRLTDVHGQLIRPVLA